MCWLACLPRMVSTRLARPPSWLALPKKKFGVVEQLGRVEEPSLAREPEQTRHRLVHAAVLARDVATPHAGAGLGRQRAQPRVDPGAHASRDLERLLVAGDFVRVEQAREDLVQRVVRRPDLAVLRAVGGPAFEHDELVGRIGADEAHAPVPVVGADRARPKIGVVALAARPDGTAVGSATERPARLRGPARLLRQGVQRVDQVVHLLEERRLQRRVVAGARVCLRDGRQVMAARVAAQPRRLAVPPIEWRGAFGLRLAKRLPEVVEEVVRIGRPRGRE